MDSDSMEQPWISHMRRPKGTLVEVEVIAVMSLSTSVLAERFQEHERGEKVPYMCYEHIGLAHPPRLSRRSSSTSSLDSVFVTGVSSLSSEVEDSIEQVDLASVQSQVPTSSSRRHVATRPQYHSLIPQSPGQRPDSRDRRNCPVAWRWGTARSRSTAECAMQRGRTQVR